MTCAAIVFVYLAVGAAVAGMLWRLGLLEWEDEACGAHLIYGLFWPFTLACLAIRVTIGAALGFIYRTVAGKR